MPNALTATGLTLATYDELVAQYTADYQSIYGTSIVLDSSSPDGQMMGIWIQSIMDLQDLLQAVYSSFDPDQAFGVTLDQRGAINGIQRQGGTFTVTPITVVTSQSVNLYGIDQAEFSGTTQISGQPVYTVADGAGNNWLLETTQLGLAAGTHVLNFSAQLTGAVTTVPNTITVPVTTVIGVTSINNPTSYTTLGTPEESDPAYRLRRQKSVSIASQGYLAGLLAALEAVTGVTSAYVYENTTASTNSDGVPSHSLWCIVAGTALAADIANAIYSKRNAGCGLYGSLSYLLTQVDGTTFPIYYDVVTEMNLFIAFTATSINGTTAANVGAVRTALVTAYVPSVYQTVDINTLATLAQKTDPNMLVTGAGFSTGLTQILNLSAVPTSGTFVLNYNGGASAAINWNDSAATIQSKMAAVTGLTGIAVTAGSLASQSVTFDLSGVSGGVQALITASSNTLLATATPITISFNEGYTATLTPPSKKNQFVISAANIIITAMQVSPVGATVLHSTGTATFTGLGGYGAYVYSLSVNNSGGSINSSTGAYTAGTTQGVTDTVLVTDAFGNTATATVTVQ